MATAVKPRVKVAPERKGTTKLWNISDWPATSVKPQSVMALGVTVHPGGSVEVDATLLEKAHKTNADIKAGLLFKGDKPPKEYLAAMGRKKRLKRPKKGAASHGEGATPVEAKAEAMPAPVVFEEAVEEPEEMGLPPEYVGEDDEE